MSKLNVRRSGIAKSRRSEISEKRLEIEKNSNNQKVTAADIAAVIESLTGKKVNLS